MHPPSLQEQHVNVKVWHFVKAKVGLMLVKLVVAIIFINLLNINTKAMSLSPWFGTGGGSLFDPLRAWDPLMDNTGWGRASDPLSLSTDIPRSITTRVDWRETDKAHVFTIDTPGEINYRSLSLPVCCNYYLNPESFNHNDWNSSQGWKERKLRLKLRSHVPFVSVVNLKRRKLRTTMCGTVWSDEKEASWEGFAFQTMPMWNRFYPKSYLQLPWVITLSIIQIKATMNNGVLSLTVPKTEQPTKEHRRIDITWGDVQSVLW